MGSVPLDLRFRGPLEAKSFFRGCKIDPPGAPGTLILNVDLVVVTAALRLRSLRDTKACPYEIFRPGRAPIRRFCAAIHGPKPYKFTGFSDIHGPRPYQFIGFGDIHGPRPYKCIGFGDSHGPKPYKFIGFGNPHPSAGGLPPTSCINLVGLKVAPFRLDREKVQLSKHRGGLPPPSFAAVGGLPPPRPPRFIQCGSTPPAGRMIYFSFSRFLGGFRPKSGPGACPKAPA